MTTTRADSADADAPDAPKYAMADGSYPINACTGDDSVESAAKLAHNSKTYSFAQVKAHVMNAKKDLGCPDSVLPASWTEQSASRGYPPRENLVRELRSGLEVRSAVGGGATLFGHFAVFNRWTEINSMWEGQFLERVAPGAFARTFKNNGANIRVTLNHGHDELGDRPIAVITDLREDDQGAYYEADLLEGVPPLVIDGLRHGQYGASFRFNVMQEDFQRNVKPSLENPDGLDERTIKEVRVAEFGPVTFPAYEGATAGVRSLTDDWIFRQLVKDPDRVYELLRQHLAPDALPPGPGPKATPPSGPAPVSVPIRNRFLTNEEWLKWIDAS